MARGGDVIVPIPPRLRGLGEATRARVVGPDGAPIAIVLGGISADRAVEDWWPGLVGRDAALDPANYRILGLDFAADESGAFAPTTHEQADIVVATLDAVGAARADLFVGASYGGMVGLALAERQPERVARLVAISAPATPHPAATAGRELQRRAAALGIASGRPDEGLSLARGLAMTSYRTPEEFAARFAGGIPTSDPLSMSEPGSYLRARGEAYRDTMSAGRFLSLSASIDRHHVDPAKVGVPTLVLGAESDRLVPAEQLRSLADGLPDATLDLFDCLYGHDMFLKQAPRIGARITAWLEAS